MTVIDSPERFEIGRVVSRTFAVLIDNAAVFLPLAVVVMIPVLVVTLLTAGSGLATLQAGHPLAPGALPAIIGSGIAVFLAAILCTYVLQAGIVQGTILSLNGEKPSIGGSLSTGLRLIVPIVVISILSLAGMMAGFVLLVIPGIILAVGWSVVIPVRIVEQTGINGAFGRSWELTRGHRWKIFLLVLLYSLLAGGIGLATRPLLGIAIVGADPRLASIPYLAFAWVERVVLAALTAVGIASIYYELRLVKEGIAPQHLLAAFD